MPDSDDKKSNIIESLLPKLLYAIVAAAAMWCWSANNRITVLESKGDVGMRVKALEDALLPVLVDWKVQKELAARLGAVSVPAPGLLPPPELNIDVDDYTKLREDADNWAKEQIQQQAPNASAPGA